MIAHRRTLPHLSQLVRGAAVLADRSSVPRPNVTYYRDGTPTFPVIGTCPIDVSLGSLPTERGRQWCSR